MSKSAKRRRPTPKPRLKTTAYAGALLLLGAPLVIVPGALNRFVFGKLTAAAIGAGLVALAPAAGRLRREAVATIAAGAVVLLAAALASNEPLAALVGRAPRYEGVFVLAAYAGALWAGARLLGPQRDERIAILAVRFLACVVLAVGFIAVLEAAGLRPLSTDVSRPGSLLGNASDEGTLGVLCLGPLALVALRRSDILIRIGAIAAIVVTVLSASRGALLAMVLQLALIGVVLGGRRATVAVLAAAVVLVGLSFSIPSTRHRVLASSPLAQHTVTGRELLWRETVKLDGSHLAIGVGPSNFKTAIVGQHTVEWQKKVGPQNPPDSPHSIPLQALSDGGLPLLLLFALLCGEVIAIGGRSGWQRRRAELPLEAGVIVSLVGYAVAGAVGLTSPGPTLLASLFLGVALSAPPKEQPSHRWIPTLAASGLLALGVVFLFAAIAEIPLRHAIVDVSQGDPAAAQHDFDVARVLRPWDVDLPDVAAHAFITYGISSGDSASVADSAGWLARVPGELHGDEQVELDNASLDEARRDYSAAESILDHVLTIDRENPAVLMQRGIVEAEATQDADAERDFLAATVIAPQDAGPWQDLATLYSDEGKTAQAAEATARADHDAAR